MWAVAKTLTEDDEAASTATALEDALRSSHEEAGARLLEAVAQNWT